MAKIYTVYISIQDKYRVKIHAITLKRGKAITVPHRPGSVGESLNEKPSVKISILHHCLVYRKHKIWSSNKYSYNLENNKKDYYRCGNNYTFSQHIC